MLLRDSLDDAVAGVTTDLSALAEASRRRGLAIRRRRRALATVGSLTAVSVLALGAHALVNGPVAAPAPVAATEVSPPSVPAELSGRTAPITDTGTAAALAASVGTVADGTLSRVQGGVSEHEAHAALVLRPEPGRPGGQVFLNLQPAAMAGRAPHDCEGRSACEIRRLPNGDWLRTYRQDDDTEYAPGSQRVAAEVISPRRRLRVVVSAMNTHPWAEGEMRAAPVLDTDQLVEIATQPWWSRTELPVEHLEAGRTLAGVSGSAGQ